MKLSTSMWVLLGIAISIILLNVIKITFLPNLDSTTNIIIETLICLISTIVPILFGLRYDKISALKDDIEDIKSYIDINSYDKFDMLFSKLKLKSKNFSRYLSSLKNDYFFIEFYKPIMDFFHLEFIGYFYDNPKSIGEYINQITKLIVKLDEKIKKDNIVSFCSEEDRIKIVSKIISISSFYNFYYAIDVNESILKIANLYPINSYSDEINLNLAIIFNDFKFNEDLLNSKILNSSTKKELELYFLIRDISITLSNARDIYLIENRINIEIMIWFFALYCQIKEDIDLLKSNFLLLIFNIELDSIKAIFEKDVNIKINDDDKNKISEKLGISDKRAIMKCDDLNEISDLIFYMELKKSSKKYNSDFYSDFIIKDKEESKDYHPIFDIYFLSNSFKKNNEFYYLPKIKELENNLDHLKDDFLKDINLWHINKAIMLINNRRYREADEIYKKYNFDNFFSKLEDNISFKYSILIIKAIILNRLEYNYDKSMEILLQILELDTYLKWLPNIENILTDLIFIFAFEKRDKKIYKKIYFESSNKDKLKEILKIMIYNKTINYLEILTWKYFHCPISHGYIKKTLTYPKIICQSKN